MTLKAVFFDMGGTIDTYRFTREQRISKMPLIRECLARVGVFPSLTDEQLAESITKGVSAYLQWNMESNVELKPEEIWSKFFLKNIHVSPETLHPVGEDLAYRYESELYIREMRSEIPSVLEKIKAMGLMIGCISNTQSLRQVPESLKHYGIFEYFDMIVLSSQYGRRKPDPSIFYYAARQANLPTSSCIYVGDKINRDVLGAKRANFRLAVKINHEFDTELTDEGAEPDEVIQNMEELLPLLEHELENDRRTSTVKDERKIKALFFDAGDILYYRPKCAEHLQEFLHGRAITPSPKLDEENRRLREMAFSGKIGRHAYYEQIIRLYGIESPKEIAKGVDAMSKDDNTVKIMDGVPETIHALKQKGFCLGIITDTAMSFTRKLNWFDQHGFGRVWDCVISSKEIGVRKPSPLMYEKALSQVGVKASEAVFIGHKKSELDGARAVGLITIAFNYDEGAMADYYIENFVDLLTLSIINA